MNFYKPTLKRKDMDSVLQAMVSEQIGPGERQTLFMQAYAASVGKSSAAAFRTYPDAIRCAFRTLGLSNGEKVAMSPLTPSVYGKIAKELGLEVALVDIDAENGCPSEKAVSESGASALVIFEACGTIPARYSTETTYAEKLDYGAVKCIEDVTQSIGSHVGDEMKAGDWGNVVVCALEEDCIVSAGGGAAVAADKTWMYELRSNRPSPYLRMPDMNAALGNIQLANCQENSARRREMAKTYQNALAKTQHKQFGFSFVDFESCCSQYSVMLSSKPDESIKFATKKEVPVSMTFKDSLASSYEGDLFETCPHAAACYYRCLSFPIYPFLKGQEVDLVSKVIAHLP